MSLIVSTLLAILIFLGGIVLAILTAWVFGKIASKIFFFKVFLTDGDFWDVTLIGLLFISFLFLLFLMGVLIFELTTAIMNLK